MGGWDWQMQIIIYRMDKQQGPIVWHREPYSIPVVTIVEKNMKKEYIYIYIYIYITESFCWNWKPAEINTTL